MVRNVKRNPVFLLLFLAVTPMQGGIASVIASSKLDCADEFILTSDGDAEDVQLIRFGTYSKTEETDHNERLIYQYKQQTGSSTFMQDSDGEWKVYSGDSTMPQFGRQVITSRCFQVCPIQCTNATFEYFDGEIFVADPTIKITSVGGIGLWWIAIVSVILIFAAGILGYVVWLRFRKKKQREIAPKDFRVLMNGRPEIEKTIWLPIDEFTLKASCQIKDLDVETQPLQYQYKYSWVNPSKRETILGDGEEYTPKNLQQGEYEYMVIVECGGIKHENTAKVIVDSGAIVQRMKVSTRYNGVKAVEGKEIWLNSTKKITKLPDILNNSVLYPLPYFMRKDESDLQIIVKKPSTVYIARIPDKQDSNTTSRSRRGWKSSDLNKWGFTFIKNEEVLTNLRLHDTGSSSLSLYKKSISVKDKKDNVLQPSLLSFATTETEESLVAIFVKKADETTTSPIM